MNWKWNKYPNGNRYKVYHCVCSYCERDIWKRKCDIKGNDNVFCNYECSRKSKFSGKTFSCFTCEKEVYRTKSQLSRSKSGDVFCSKTCATITNNTRYKTKENHPNWNGGQYRTNALEYYGPHCQNNQCPFRHIKINVKMLDVHHKNGNRKNNNLDNLEVLCVWCHALATRGCE